MKAYFHLMYLAPHNKTKVFSEEEARVSSEALVGLNRWVNAMVELQRATRPYKNVLRQLVEVRRKVDDNEDEIDNDKEKVAYLDRYKDHLQNEKK